MKTFTLTEEQATSLTMFLLISANYRQGEEKACKELGAELNEDGTLKFKNMKDNGEWWKKQTKGLKKSEK